MTLIRRQNAKSPREQRAKLNKDGSPRRRPGPRPRTVAIQASTAVDSLQACIAAFDAEPTAAAAAAAYKRAMPPLQTVPVSQWATIVATGMQRGALSGKEASTMLYAAQVAHSGAR